MDKLKFHLKQRLTIKASGESGEVTVRAEYANGAEPGYCLHYKAGDGRAVSGWFDESQLEAVPGGEVKTG